MRAGEYLAMALLAGVGWFIVDASKRFNFKAAEISTFKLWLIQIASLIVTMFGSRLLDGSYSIFGYILLIVGIPVLIFSTTIGFYRLLFGKL